MVDRSEFVVTFSFKDKGLVKQFGQVGKSGKQAGDKIEKGMRRGDRAQKTLSKGLAQLRTRLLGIGTAITAAFTFRQGLADATAFGRSIAEVGTIAGVSAEELRNLRDQTLDLATGLGLNEVDTAGGLYQTLSAGITEAADAQLVLEAATKLAVAGVSDANATVDLLTSAINAYGFDAEEAARLSDSLFQTVRAGKTTVSELAASFGQVAPIAATAGVSFEQLSAAIATTTLAGLSTSEAATQIRSVITALGKRADEVRKVFRSVGRDFEFTDIATRGLVPILQDLRDILDDDAEALINLFGRAEAANAAFNLTGRNLENYNRILGEVENSTNAVADALNVQFAEAAVRLDAQVNALRQGILKLGSAFIEGFTGEAPDNIEEFEESLISLREEIGAYEDDLRGLGSVVGFLGSLARATTGSFRFLGAGLSVERAQVDKLRNSLGDSADDLERQAEFADRLQESQLSLETTTIALAEAFGSLLEMLGSNKLAKQADQLKSIRDAASQAVEMVEALSDAAAKSRRISSSQAQFSGIINIDPARSRDSVGALFDAVDETVEERSARFRAAVRKAVEETEKIFAESGKVLRGTAAGASRLVPVGFEVRSITDELDQIDREVQAAANQLQGFADDVDLGELDFGKAFEALANTGLEIPATALQDTLFGEERLALISQLTEDFDRQREAINGIVDAEAARIAALAEGGQVTLSQADALNQLLEALRAERLEVVQSAEDRQAENENREKSRETTKRLRGELDALIGAQKRAGLSTRELSAIIDELRGAAREPDETLFRNLLGDYEEELAAASSLFARFTTGLKGNVESAGDISQQLGSSLGNAFDGLIGDLALAEQGWDAFRDSAIRAIAQVISRLIALRIAQAATSFFDFGTSESATVSDLSLSKNAQGGTLGAGGKPINFGAFPTGGVVRDPTVTLFGDQSNAFKGEAFVPIPSDAKGIPVDFRGGAPSESEPVVQSPPVTINISAVDSRSFNDQIAQSRTRDLIIGIISDAMRGAHPGLRQTVKTVATSA